MLDARVVGSRHAKKVSADRPIRHSSRDLGATARRYLERMSTESQTATPYEPATIETKWRERWAARGTNVANIDGARKPFYALMMFPYPSAEGLHVGNLFAFTGNDIYARFQRMQGSTSSSRSATTLSESTRRTSRSRSAFIPRR